MEPDVWQPCLRQKFLELAVGPIRIYWGFRTKWIMENPGRERFSFSLSEKLSRGGRQDDFSSARIGFGIPSYQPAALFTMKGAVYFQDTAAGIEVRPHETADLTPAQAGGQLSLEEIIPDRILPDHIHESIQLFCVPNFHGLADHFGWLYLISGIGRD